MTAGPIIRYVVLSDLHLGDRDSILTAAAADGDGVDASVAGAVLVELVGGLRELLAQQQQRPTLIINGDFLDLAFGSMSNALMMFERFAELALAPGEELFDDILYLPGNHDHHLWEMARETHYRLEVASHHHEHGMPEPNHTTPLGADGAIASLLLDQVLAHLYEGGVAPESRPRVRVVYPNLALYEPTHDRCVVIHHGHYVEPIYQLFSRGRRLLFPERPAAETVEQIEAENFAWVDFIWSLLGRSGAAGEDAETLFEMLRYPNRMRDFAADLANRSAPHVRMPFLPFLWARRLVLRDVLTRVVARLTGERGHLDVVCTPRTMRGATDYLFGPTWRQVRSELGSIPSDMTFVFGHTHKPFETVLEHPQTGQLAQVLNTGGWTVDTDAGSPAFGSAIVLISEALEVASVRVYNDGPTACVVPLEVRVPRVGRHDGQPPLPGDTSFAGQIAARFGSLPDGSWRRLSGNIHAAVARRRMRHRERFG